MTLAGAATGRNPSSTFTLAERGLEVVDVALERRLARIGDRPDADRFRDGRRRLAGIELGIELGEARAVGAARERIGARLDRPPLEAAQALDHVLRPADRLAELAVAHHVDAGFGLPAHHLGDRVGEAFVVGAPGRTACRSAGRARNPATASGRIRLPTWVVRMRDVLRFMGAFGDGAAAGCGPRRAVYQIDNADHNRAWPNRRASAHSNVGA